MLSDWGRFSTFMETDILTFESGSCSKDSEIDIDKSIQSHYFIKFDNPLTDEIFDKFTTIDYCCKNHTVGPKSISKQELIKEFNKIF